MRLEALDRAIRELVRRTLEEDVGSGDLTADLIPQAARARARLVAREPAVLCGIAWFDTVFEELDPEISIDWRCREGEDIEPGQVLCRLEGPARPLLTGERSALNLLQTLSGTATTAREYARLVADLPVRLLDTRKTLPGLRLAQKHAVRVGGCHNHRLGLFDAILIKENHIQACGGIRQAVEAARARHPGVSIEIEVENLDELREALAAGADRILLDNFDLDALREAVRITGGHARLEASGNITRDNLREIAKTGIDDISLGALTKHLRAIDFSLRFD